MISPQTILQAYERIKDVIRRTPLEYSPGLSLETGAEIYLKLENWQLTGSFKFRGAINKILSLAERGYQLPVVTASTGNHAAAVAQSLEEMGLGGIIFLPENVSGTKAERLKGFLNVELRSFGNDSIETEREARRYADNQGLEFISPYNDQEIIAGQGTIGVEIGQQLPDVDHIFVPVGGGGLVAGISRYMKSLHNDIVIVGCQPENSRVMYESVKAGRVLDIDSSPTLADGTAGGVESDSLTFEYCQQLVDHWSLVSEEEILASLKLLIKYHSLVVEGAAALALASVLREKRRYTGRNAVLIICGNKFDNRLLRMLAD